MILNEKKTAFVNPTGLGVGKPTCPPTASGVQDLDASFALEEENIPVNIDISKEPGIVFLGVPIPVLHPLVCLMIILIQWHLWKSMRRRTSETLCSQGAQCRTSETRGRMTVIGPLRYCRRPTDR